MGKPVWTSLKPMDSIVIHDLRDPWLAMGTLSLKVPTAALDDLQALADHLRCSRSALARTLLMNGLEKLLPAPTTKEVA
jgi:hypothetical protein